MNNRTRIITIVILLVMSLVWLDVVVAKGPRVRVEQAIPGEAEQGQTGLPVKIKGQNFQAGDTVHFLIAGTNDEAQIQVPVVVYDPATGDLDTIIDVEEAAIISNYDIEVRRSGGRGGKGTDLFKVQAKNGGGHTSLGDDYTATDGVEFINPSDVGLFDYHIIGTPTEDEIYAGDGKDLIEGGGGQDNIWARGGDDEVLVGGGHIYGGTGDDLIIVGDESYNLWGDDGDDILIGGEGGGGISGGKGTDWLEGGDGDDWFNFSLGSLIFFPDQYDVDHYDGNLGSDTLTFPYSGSATEEHNEESVFIDMTQGIYQATVSDPSGAPVTVNGDFFNIEAFWMTDGADVFVGVDNVDIKVSGSAGNDNIRTFNGNDSIDAGYGDDVVYAGDGDDFIRAEAGNDVIYGEGGNDVISGYGGDNFGNATRQDDELHGGEGCDVFTFSRPGGDQIDTIMDFDYPYDEVPCERINFSYSDYWRVDFRNLDITYVGDDIVIDLVVKRGGGEHLTVILKDAVINGVTVDESTFTFEYPNF